MAKSRSATARTDEPIQGDLIEKIEENTNSAQPVDVSAKIPVDNSPKEEQLEEEKTVESASEALQKQIEALKKSEEIQRNRAEIYAQEREEALFRARAQEVEASKFRKEAISSQYDSVSTALHAATAEAEIAKREIKTAIGEGDAEAQTEAYERLAIARSNISKLEDGKFELESRIRAVEAAPRVEQQRQQRTPASVSNFLSKHPEYLTDPRKNAKISSLHFDAVDAGHEFGDDGYMNFIETSIGVRASEEQQSRQQGNAMVSAPVSREAPSTTTQGRGQVRLTVSEREAAKISGVTEKVYAENLQKLNEMRANGTYGDRQ